jgi:hypothetical protein
VERSGHVVFTHSPADGEDDELGRSDTHAVYAPGDMTNVGAHWSRRAAERAGKLVVDVAAGIMKRREFSSRSYAPGRLGRDSPYTDRTPSAALRKG